MAEQNKVPLQSLNPQQILQIKQQLQNDLNILNQSMNQFRFAFQKYEEFKNVVKSADECSNKDEILIPLSNSLFIPGHIDNVRNGQKYYLVDYGTGYFVERTAKQASEFCDRKNALIKEKSEKLGLLINDKKVMLEKCSMTLMSMMNQQQQQQQQAQK